MFSFLEKRKHKLTGLSSRWLYSATNNGQELQSLPSLPTFDVFSLLNFGRSNGRALVSQGFFECAY